MAKSSKLKDAAIKIGSAIGKAEGKAHKVAAAGSIAREELIELSNQVNALTKQLKKTTKRLKKALK